MKDREFLMWIHERLEHVYGDKPIMDSMHKLRAVIRATDPDKETPNLNTCNSLQELKLYLIGGKN